MLILGRDRMRSPELGYAKTFLRQLEDCLALALEKKVTIVANAGGLNPAGLADAIREIGARQGLDVKVAHVEGTTSSTGWELGLPADAGVPVTANAYLGAFGIARCLDAGADVVVTGRVTDASVIVGPAISHVGWGRGDLDALAGATAAGHVIECGTQATGGNYAFFNRGETLTRRPGFLTPRSADGTWSSPSTPGPGCGHDGTVTSTLYEVTGARYGGPDVVTRLDTASSGGAGPRPISGVRGEPAPPTTRCRSPTRRTPQRDHLPAHGPGHRGQGGLVERQFRAGPSANWPSCSSGSTAPTTRTPTPGRRHGDADHRRL